MRIHHDHGQAVINIESNKEKSATWKNAMKMRKWGEWMLTELELT